MNDLTAKDVLTVEQDLTAGDVDGGVAVRDASVPVLTNQAASVTIGRDDPARLALCYPAVPIGSDQAANMVVSGDGARRVATLDGAGVGSDQAADVVVPGNGSGRAATFDDTVTESDQAPNVSVAGDGARRANADNAGIAPTHQAADVVLAGDSAPLDAYVVKYPLLEQADDRADIVARSCIHVGIDQGQIPDLCVPSAHVSEQSDAVAIGRDTGEMRDYLVVPVQAASKWKCLAADAKEIDAGQIDVMDQPVVRLHEPRIMANPGQLLGR